jgi:hypothetical protein
MEEYFFYSQFDISKQKHGSGRFISLEEAVSRFAINKNMSNSEFLTFFKVEKNLGWCYNKY